jgi:5-(carboxyamino)imidazole ribonucleotide mutase
MPAGVPVATVALNNAKNAGILAAQILATSNDLIHSRIIKYKEKLKTQVEYAANEIESTGYNHYLENKKED